MARLSFKARRWSASHTKRALSLYFSIGRFCLCIGFVEAGTPDPIKDATNA